MKNNKCGIYYIRNNKSNKIYVGRSVNINRRINCHKSELKRNRHVNNYLQKAWNKYGENNFEFGILELCNKGKLKSKEKFWIKKYNSKNPINGYNLTDGGDGILNVSDVVKKKISDSSKRFSLDKNPMWGKKHSLETRMIFSKQRIGNKNGVGNKNNLGNYGKRKGASSKYLGVNKGIRIGKNKTVIYWNMRFSFDNKTITKNFMNEIEAAKAFDKKSWNVYHDLSKLNFPEDYK